MFLFGDTSSNGCCSTVMLVFGGVSLEICKKCNLKELFFLWGKRSSWKNRWGVESRCYFVSMQICYPLGCPPSQDAIVTTRMTTSIFRFGDPNLNLPRLHPGRGDNPSYPNKKNPWEKTESKVIPNDIQVMGSSQGFEGFDSPVMQPCRISLCRESVLGFKLGRCWSCTFMWNTNH